MSVEQDIRDLKSQRLYLPHTPFFILNNRIYKDNGSGSFTYLGEVDQQQNCESNKLYVSDPKPPTNAKSRNPA